MKPFRIGKRHKIGTDYEYKCLKLIYLNKKILAMLKKIKPVRLYHKNPTIFIKTQYVEGVVSSI